MSITLSADLERFVQAKVESGEYGSPGEVVDAALKLLHARDQERVVRQEEIKRQIALGVEQADRGEVVSGDVVFRELREAASALQSQQ